MVEVDVHFFYWFSMALYPVHALQGQAPLIAVAPELAIARLALESISPEFRKILPDTASKIDELAQAIDGLGIPRSPGGILPPPNRVLSPIEATRLKGMADTIKSTLQTESGHRYVLCVLDQKGFSAYNLVEKIDNFFSENVWTKISSDSKREFKESGRCLSLERYTGSGFHALRAVECVIRQYIEAVGGAPPKKRDWWNYLDTLRQNDAGADVIAVLDNVRSLERNPLMHPEHWLDIDDAIAVFNISNTAVVRLIADLEKKGKI